ncbi:MAG: peroxiredoxin family protein [Planctomycetes bacterium]|nr:peroxiredoxin family protein [Planctomycetota bacterium]
MRQHLVQGDPAPDFTLKTPHDVEISLHPPLLKGPVLLEFIRGTWDPASRERIAELAASRDRFRELKGTPLVVSCEDTDGAGKILDAGTCPFSLLIDAHLEASRAFGVFQKFSWGAVTVARPASFIIDRCGFGRHSRAGSSPIDAAPVETLLEKFDSLRKEEETRDQA